MLNILFLWTSNLSSLPKIVSAPFENKFFFPFFLSD